MGDGWVGVVNGSVVKSLGLGGEGLDAVGA